ncbi:MAG: Gfo/Idh/MocA family oxidoreductase, partial [Phycisphaerae bacterium]|nr:Gfo/Idh/MocA family oxidoreductase [Phycisphaerae bacterium]
MGDKIRIGFVGVGGMGQMAHLTNYVTMKDCEVAAVAEIRGQTGQLVATRYGIPKVYPDHKAMLAAEKLDGIVASQPFDRHAVLLPELYPACKFVFTEKPIAVAPEAGKKLADQAKAARCTHMVGYHKRSDPATEYARKTVDEWKASGKMGALKYVRILMPAGDWVAEGMTGRVDAGDKAPPLARELEKAWSGGIVGDMDAETSKQYVAFVNYYIHQVNLMRHLLGEPYEVAYAEKTGVLLAVRSASGIAGVIEMTPYQTTIEWEESALIAFEKGYIMLRLPAPLAVNRCGTVEIYSDPKDGNPPERRQPTMPWIHAMRQQACNFVRVIRGEMAPPCAAA